MAMCVSAGTSVRESPGCSTHTLHHEHNYSLPSRPSVAAASSSSKGHHLSTTDASFPSASCPPPCLRLPTPAKDPPPRFPSSKSRSPMVSSMSMLCSSLAAYPPMCSEPAKIGATSPRYELAAIALLSTVPIHRKAWSRLRDSPSERSRATCRSSSPFRCNFATSVPNVTGSAATLVSQIVPSASPSTRNRGNSCTRRDDFTVTALSPQVASPVRRKTASSVLPPRSAAQNTTFVHESEQGDVLQPQTHALPCFSQGIRARHVVDALDIAAAPCLSTPEGDVVEGLCMHNGVLERNTCSRHGPDTQAELSFFPSDIGKWNTKLPPASGICRQPSEHSLRQGENPCPLHRIPAATSPEGSTATRACREETSCLCEFPLLQKPAVPTHSTCWNEKGGEDSPSLLRVATDTTSETAQPAAMPYFPATEGLSQLSCNFSKPYMRQHRRTCRTNCAECTPFMSCNLTKAAASGPCFATLSEPTRLFSAAERTPPQIWGAPSTQCLGNKEVNTDVQKTLTCVSRSVCHRHTTCSPIQMFVNTDPFMSEAGVSLTPVATRCRSLGGDAGSCFSTSTEEAGCAGNLSRHVPQLIHSTESEPQLFTEHPLALLHRERGSATPMSANRDAHPCLISAAGELVNCPRQKTYSRSARSPRSCQASSLTTLGTVDSPGNGQVAMLGADGPHAASALPGARGYGGEPSSSSVLNVAADEEAQQIISTDAPTRAQEAWSAGQRRRNWRLEYSGKTNDEEQEDRCTIPGGAIGGCVKELPQTPLGRKSPVQGWADEGALAEAIVEDSEGAYLFSELQHTLKELQAHRTALHARDIVFETAVSQEPFLLGPSSAARETEDGTLSRTEEIRMNTQICDKEHALQYCLLEEGSFGKVFVGRFLGKLRTNGARRWWRTLPLCERFLHQATYALPSPVTGLLPLHVQEATESNVKVAIKVPVKSMMLRDPLGVIGRTLNEWKILELVHEKRMILFSQDHGREDADRATHGIVQGRATYSGDAALRSEVGTYDVDGVVNEDIPLLFCQEQASHEHFSPHAFKSWHPMHPQAEPPGVVELIGGVIHGPLDVWLVTRLAAGKDLHTRKYSKRLADGVSIPPAAGLAMCRQLAAIVDFLHARTKQTSTSECATADATRGYQQTKVQCPCEERLTCGGPDERNDSVGSFNRAHERYGERELDRDLSCNVRNAPVIVHRDIKPENIIVDDNWRIQLCDFGDAEATPDGVVTRVSGATWLYAPVELLCAAPLNDSRNERRCELKSRHRHYSRRRSGNNISCIKANGTCCDSRAPSCPTREGVQNHWKEGCACDDTHCTDACQGSSYRGTDAVFTEKWDIWSMGCVFQEMFGFPNPMSYYVAPTDPPQIIYKKLKRKAQEGQLMPVIAPEIQGIARQIIFACLRSDPKARPSATAVLRMWSAPEQEILKDIRLPVSLSTVVHGTLHARGPLPASHQHASSKEPSTRPPGLDRYSRARTRGHKEHEQSENEGHNFNKSAPIFAYSERPYSCVVREDAGTSTHRRFCGQEDAYVVPNVAVVQY